MAGENFYRTVIKPACIWHGMLGYKKMSFTENKCSKDIYVSLDVR